MQCGVAALAMVCNYYGKNYSVKYLEDFCHPTVDGISLKGIYDAAIKLGLSAYSSKIGIDELMGLPMPLILHWNQNHFVVLYKISKKGKCFYIADPAKGKIRYNVNDLKKHWLSSFSANEYKGVGLYLEPTENFYNRLSEKNKTENSFSFISSYLNKYRHTFFKIFLAVTIGCILQFVLPFLTQSIVDKGIKNKDIGFIWMVLLGELMLVIGRAITDFFRRWLLLHISLEINISLLSDFFIKLLKLPMAFFDTKLTGDILQRIGDHTRIQGFLTGQVLNIVFSFFSFFIFGIVLFIYSPLILGVFFTGSLFYGIWIALFLNKRKVLDYELFELQAKNQNKTYQFISSMQEIKLQNCEGRRRSEWEEIQFELFEVQLKSLRLQQTQEAGSIFLNEIKNILITVIAATSVINGGITLGTMLAIQYIIGQLNSPVEQIMSFIYSMQDVKISLTRINEIHNGKNEEPNYDRAKSFETDNNIHIKDMLFKYDHHSTKNTLEDVSFNIPAGKITAIVGTSGSGKTTLLKLILGYYPLLSGSISIGGRDLMEYNLKWWRQQCGVVMQDGVIFSESIARNIAVGDDDIDTHRLEEAANIANIHNFVMSLPLKYNTIIGKDGVGISQGQKQRILIARAVYKDPDFIFLDEATNSLDAKNEKIIVNNLCEFYNGRTVVVVAHRLSTVKNADQIIVMDRGRVVETGNHSSLIEKKGAYYKLIKNQLEL